MNTEKTRNRQARQTTTTRLDNRRFALTRFEDGTYQVSTYTTYGERERLYSRKRFDDATSAWDYFRGHQVIALQFPHYYGRPKQAMLVPLSR